MKVVRAGFVLVLLFVALLLLFGALGLPAAVARGLSRDGVAAIAVTTLIARVVYFIVLFLVAPQGITLRVLRVRSRSAFLFVGALSGLFFLSVLALSADWFTAASRAHGIADAVGMFLGTFVLRPISVGQAIWFAAGPAGLVLSAFFGALLGWLWSLPTYRLPGDHGRDWEPRILGRQPPYG